MKSPKKMPRSAWWGMSNALRRSICSVVAQGDGGCSPHETAGDEPVLEESAIFYNLVFDFGGALNPTEAMRRLLDEDVAIAAANSMTGTVELATRFRELQRLHREANLLAEFAEYRKVSSVRHMLGWVLRHPRTTSRFLRIGRQQTGLTQEKEEVEQESRELTDTLNESIAFIDQAMGEAQLWNQLQYHSDRSVFNPQYLVQIPFARVTLQPFKATIEGHEITADVEVLLHRTGVGILRVAVLLTEPLTIDQVIRLQFASKARVTRWEVARQLIETHESASGMSSWTRSQEPMNRDFSGGIEWLINSHADDLTLRDVLHLYRLTIISSVLRKAPRKLHEAERWLRTQDWFAYPILYVRRSTPQLATAPAFKARYGRVLAGIVGRTLNWQAVKAQFVEDMIRDDYSLTDEESVYIEEGSAAVVYHGRYVEGLREHFGDDIPGQQWLWAHFQRSALVDALLVQRWILHTLQQQLGVLPANLKRLNAIKRDLALALAEYHAVTFSYGSANDTVKRARKTMGIDDTYAGVSARLANLENLIETRETNARHHRDVMLRVATSAATVLLGLPGAHQMTVVLASWHRMPASQRPEWIPTPFTSLLAYADAQSMVLTLVIYGVLVGVILPVTLWTVRPRRDKRPIVALDRSSTAARTGFSWPSNMVDSKPEPEDGQAG